MVRSSILGFMQEMALLAPAINLEPEGGMWEGMDVFLKVDYKH